MSNQSIWRYHTRTRLQNTGTESCIQASIDCHHVFNQRQTPQIWNPNKIIILPYIQFIFYQIKPKNLNKKSFLFWKNQTREMGNHLSKGSRDLPESPYWALQRGHSDPNCIVLGKHELKERNSMKSAKPCLRQKQK